MNAYQQQAPDWHGAAANLVEAFVQFPDLEDRLRVLEKLCLEMQDNLYPAILQILLMVEHHGDSDAKTLVAETLAYAVSIQRLPEGKMSAWGSSSLNTAGSFGSYRSLGPLEYLCTWFAQPNALQPLSSVAFRTAMTGMLALINASEAGSRMYQQKLLADSTDLLTGALTAQTRNGIKALAVHWQQDHDPDTCTTAFMDAIGSHQSLQGLGHNPFT